MTAPVASPSKTEEFLLLQPGALLVRLVGVASALIAVVLAILLAWFTSAAATRSPPPAGAWVFVVVVSMLTAFFSVAAYRLLLNRTNRFGSLFPPAAWYVLAVILFGQGLAGVWLSVTRGDSSDFNGVLSAFLIALLSYAAGAHFSRKARGSGAASQETPSK